MKIIAVLSITLFTLNAQAQTKVISHKRHGGTSHNFKNEWFVDPSNFGAAPVRFVQNARLDSVILISDKVAVMVTSEVCARENWDNTRSNESIWKAGKDTVYNHVLFNGKNDEDDIRNVLTQDYYFQNESKSVVLVGFKKSEPERLIFDNNDQTAATTMDSASVEMNSNKKKHRKKGHFMRWIMFSVLAVFFRTPL